MTMTATEDLVVRTKAGELRGACENGIAVFRGVPYAAAPVGELRFSPPQPVPAWRGVRDATKDGPIAPQGRSRLAHVMGDFERPQSEDCLTLNIWTPAPDSTKAPGAGVDPRRRIRERIGFAAVVFRRAVCRQRRRGRGFDQLPARRAGVPVPAGGERRQSRTARSGRGAAFRARQYCRLRRRSGQRDGGRAVGGSGVDRDPHDHAAGRRSVPARDPAKHAVRTHVADARRFPPDRAALAGGAGPQAGRSGQAQIAAVRPVRDCAGRGRPPGEEIRRCAGAVLAGDRRQRLSR